MSARALRRRAWTTRPGRRPGVSLEARLVRDARVRRYAKKRKKHCGWVAKKAKKLCKLKTKDADGVSAFEACPSACQICDIACNVDSSDWYSKTKKKVRP